MAIETWSTAMLDLLKAPKTPANYKFLNSWAAREHADHSNPLSDGSNNPFFTTAGGSATVGPIKAGTMEYWNSFGPGNAYHVAKYPNLEVGVYANAAHIATGYPSIAAALRSGNPASFANNQNFQRDLTRWSGSGYSSVMMSGAAGPVGPVVDTGSIAKKVIAAGKGSGFGVGDVAGTINDVLRKVPGVAQAEGAVSGVADAAGSVAGFLGKLTDPSFILRGLQIVAGGALVMTGTVLLARQVALAADLPDPVKVAGLAAGPAGRAAVAASNAAASRRPDGPTATEGVTRRTESVDASSGMTRAQAREARAARNARRPEPAEEIPF